jgi:hypothetical protein
MPLRLILDDGAGAPDDAALVGARHLDPPEVEFMAETGIDASLDLALAGVDATYVALDLDVLDPAHVDVPITEPDGRFPRGAGGSPARHREPCTDRRDGRHGVPRNRPQRRACVADARGGSLLEAATRAAARF